MRMGSNEGGQQRRRAAARAGSNEGGQQRGWAASWGRVTGQVAGCMKGKRADRSVSSMAGITGKREREARGWGRCNVSGVHWVKLHSYTSMYNVALLGPTPMVRDGGAFRSCRSFAVHSSVSCSTVFVGRCNATPCRAVRCDATPCRAVQCLAG